MTSWTLERAGDYRIYHPQPEVGMFIFWGKHGSPDQRYSVWLSDDNPREARVISGFRTLAQAKEFVEIVRQRATASNAA